MEGTPYLIVHVKLGSDVLDVAPANGPEEDNEEDPIKVHAEDRADVIIAAPQNICQTCFRLFFYRAPRQCSRHTHFWGQWILSR